MSFYLVTLLLFAIIDLYDLGLRQLLVAHVDSGHHSLRQIQEGLTHDRVYFHGSRLTGIATLTDALYDRYLSQQRTTHLFSEVLATVLAKDIVFVLGQFSRREPSHILHEAEDRHVDFVVALHVDTLPGIGQCHLLWCGDDHSTGDGQCLQQRQMDVGGSRWRVKHKIIEIAPVSIGDELLQR